MSTRFPRSATFITARYNTPELHSWGIIELPQILAGYGYANIIYHVRAKTKHTLRVDFGHEHYRAPNG